MSGSSPAGDNDGRAGVIARFRQGLTRTRRGFADRLRDLVAGRGPLTDDVYEDLEAVLLQADVGVETTVALLERLRERARRERAGDAEVLLPMLREEMAALLAPAGKAHDRALRLDQGPPAVIMMVGVNGTGKTTTTGKLACLFVEEGRKVVLAAADTFRAAAADQLSVWAEKAGADLVRHSGGGDPAAVAFDAVRAGRARHADIVLIDTAGRLHTKANLMEELKKIHRVVARELPGAPHEVLLVLDATTGQNALQQAHKFMQFVDITGVILTKLDGTAKGGIALAIEQNLPVPVKLVGLGEDAGDLRPFDPEAFLDAIFA